LPTAHRQELKTTLALCCGPNFYGSAQIKNCYFAAWPVNNAFVRLTRSAQEGETYRYVTGGN